MHFKLGLPFTECSLFFRGVNFEVKHASSFGIDNNDLAKYKKLKDQDILD